MEVESFRSWSFVIFGFGSLGELGSLGFVVVESDRAGGTSVLKEAMPAYFLMELLLLGGRSHDPVGFFTIVRELGLFSGEYLDIIKCSLMVCAHNSFSYFSIYCSLKYVKSHLILKLTEEF